MKAKTIHILILFSVFVFSQLNAQENIDALLITAAQNNPGLKALYDKYCADLEKVPQVSSLPDPDVSFGFFVQPMELMSGNQRGQMQLMQMFPWFGTLKASKDEAAAMALSSYELFRAEKEDIFFNVRTNYFQLFLAQKQIQIYDSTLILLKSIENLLLSKLSTSNISGSTGSMPQNNPVQGNNSMNMNSGNQPSNQSEPAPMKNQSMTGSSSSFADLLRIQVELKELEDNIALLRNRKQMMIIQINLLLNRTYNTEIFIPDSLNLPSSGYDDPALIDSIKANNPMTKMNRADILAYQKRQQMNKKMGYPMIGVGLNYMFIDKSEMSTSGMDGKDMIMPMISMKLPVYRKKYNASIKEAEFLESSSNQQLMNSENMLMMEYSGYLFALNDAERKLSLYKDIISLTKKSFDFLLLQYSSSGADLDAIIRLHRELLDYKLTVYQAQVDKFSAIAGLQKLLSKD